MPLSKQVWRCFQCIHLCMTACGGSCLRAIPATSGFLPVSPGSSPEFSDVSERWELLGCWSLHRAWRSCFEITVKGFCSCWCSGSSMGCFLPGRPEGGRILLFISKDFKLEAFFKGVDLYARWSNISSLRSHRKKSQSLSAPCSTTNTRVTALKREDLNLW